MKFVSLASALLVAAPVMTSCGSDVNKISGSETLTQTTFMQAAIADCTGKETLPSGAIVEQTIRLNAVVRQNGSQKTPIGLTGSYSAHAINSADFNHFFVNFNVSNGDFFKIMSADKNAVDISTAGSAEVNVEGVESQQLLNTVFIDVRSNSVSLQLKDTDNRASELNVTCPEDQKLSNVWLFSQPHVVGN